jgi:hypothetical protein
MSGYPLKADPPLHCRKLVADAAPATLCGNQSIFLSEGVNLTASVTVALGMVV